MVWSLTVRSFCMLVSLVMSISWTHVSGQGSLIELSSKLSEVSNVYTGVYGTGTPISDLVNESRHLSYLPVCYHAHPGNEYVLELYRTDTNTVISRSNGSVDATKHIYWPPSALSPNDSATYKCRTSSTDIAAESFLLSVVVSVNITEFDISKEIINRTFPVICCANGYPEPSVAINVTGPSFINVMKSNGIFNTCRTVNLSVPMKYEKVYVMCEAELAPFNCTAEPPAAHTLCAATTTKTNATKTIANVNPTSTSSSMLSSSAFEVTTQGSTSASSKSSSSKVAVIAGSVSGGLVIVAFTGIGVYLCFYRKKPCRSGG